MPYSYYSFEYYRPEIKIDSSCDLSPLKGCASSIVLPANDAPSGDVWTRENGEKWRKQYLW
jgi:hypothetical protein